MICRYYEFNLDNAFSVTSLPSGVHDCQSCDKKTCKYCHDVQHSLTKQRFSWVLSRIFKFPEGTFEKGNLKDSKVGIRLIHPQESTIWSIQCKNEESGIYYVALRKKLSIKCKDITELNKVLHSEKFSYDGRPLTESDFTFTE